MKLTCVIETRIPDLRAPIIHYAQTVPGVELTEAPWTGDTTVDIPTLFRRIETDGPDGEAIPSAFTNNPDTEILVGSFCPFAGKGMDVFNNLRLIGVIRAGMENIDIDAATQRGIAVVNAVGRNADAVSDFTIGMMLAEARNIARAHHSIVSGGWQKEFPSSATTPDMRGKTIGLVGFGNIGKLMAEKLSGFHVNIIAYDPFVKSEVLAEYNVKAVDKETLFKEADFVSIHARLTPDTHHTVGKKELEAMKPTAYFINTARAGLVDYDALYQVLKDHKIAGAALDVFENEPLDEHDPFRSLDNVTLTTHRAGATLDANTNSPRLIFERIQNLIAGKKTDGFVNPQVLDNPEFIAWREKAKKQMGL